MRLSSLGQACGVLGLLSALACGGSESPKSAADAPETEVDDDWDSGDERDRRAGGDAEDSGGNPAEQAPEADEQDVVGIPTQCAQRSDDLCVPPARFVRRLCDGTFADVALIMFQGPWSRGFLTGKTEAWNASGGASVQGWLEFDEEVLILRARKPKEGGMQIEGQGTSYDVLRWNGSCATLEGGELTLDEPPHKKHSRVEWKWLGPNMRDALRESDEVTQIWRARRKECKGVSMGTVSEKCEQLDKKLVDVIVAHVRSGGKLGEPAEMP